MTKKESLDFLQSCLEHIEGLTKEEAMKFIGDMNDAENNTTPSETNFEFILPTNNNFEVKSYTDNKFFNASDIILNNDFYKNLVEKHSNIISENVRIAA